jgi:crescentin
MPCVRAALLDRSSNLAEALKARETSHAHAEQKIKVLTDRTVEMEAEANAYRAKAERRIDELSASLQRERVELAVAQGALETTRHFGRTLAATNGSQSRSGIGYDQRAAED